MKPEQIVFRQNAISHLYTAGDMGLLPDVIDNFGIFPTGESSVVFLVNPNTAPFVVKMVDRPGPVESEAKFFQQWASMGVKVPQVLGIHTADTSIPASFSVLEFINAPNLESVVDTQGRLERGISRKMGIILAKMHLAKGNGYGTIVGDTLVGMDPSLTKNLEYSLFSHRVSYLLNKQIITLADVDMARRSVQILESHLARGIKPSLTHNDFRPYNLMATDPITVIDPNPQITHPTLCLATTLIKSKTESSALGYREADEILAGYREITPVDDHILSAAIILKSLHHIYVWSQKGKDKKTDLTLSLMRREQDII